jgi:hypothetical protein
MSRCHYYHKGKMPLNLPTTHELGYSLCRFLYFLIGGVLPWPFVCRLLSQWNRDERDGDQALLPSLLFGNGGHELYAIDVGNNNGSGSGGQSNTVAH